MLEKATFFMLKASHINGTRVVTSNRNSYPYYQDKKELVPKELKSNMIKVIYLTLNTFKSFIIFILF